MAYGLRLAGFRDTHIIDETVKDRLARVELWGEIKDRLRESALGLASVYRLSRQNTPRRRAKSKSPRKGEAKQGRHCMTFQNCFGQFEPIAWNFAQLAIWHANLPIATLHSGGRTAQVPAEGHAE
jgi:hypothetical protein